MINNDFDEEDGEVAEFRLSKKQSFADDIMDDPFHIEVGYGGAGRGGKSIFGAYKFTTLALNYPDTRYGIGRKELKTLKETTLVSIFKVFRMLKLKEGIDYKYKDKESAIEFANGSKFIFLDLKYQPSDPLYEWLGGYELTSAWVDESGEVPSQAIAVLQTRVGNWNNAKYGIKGKVLETFNPSKGHVYTRYWKPSEFKENNMPNHRIFIRALPTDNPDIEPDWIENVMKTGNKVIIARLIEGNFDYDDDKLKIFNYDKLTDLFTNTKITGKKFITIDPAGKGKDKTVVMVWDGWVVTDIYFETETDQSRLFEKIRNLQQQHDVPNSQTIVDYTGIGAGLGDFLKCKTFQGAKAPMLTSEELQKKTNGEDFASINLLYLNLRSQCFFELANKINDNKISVKTDDRNLQESIVEELDCIKEVPVNLGEKRKIIPKDSDKVGVETIKSLLGHSPDFADCMSMRMYFEYNEEPEYAIYSF